MSGSLRLKFKASDGADTQQSQMEQQPKGCRLLRFAYHLSPDAVQTCRTRPVQAPCLSMAPLCICAVTPSLPFAPAVP